MNDRRKKWKLAEWKFYDSLCIWRDERRKIFCRPKKIWREEEKMKTMHASHVPDWGEARRNVVFAGTVEKYFLIGWYVTYFLWRIWKKCQVTAKESTSAWEKSRKLMRRNPMIYTRKHCYTQIDRNHRKFVVLL